MGTLISELELRNKKIIGQLQEKTKSYSKPTKKFFCGEIYPPQRI